ncbi:multicomponent Na+:H+ antiporter subunit F [Natronocella acetinitrilica]|uniref:Multicomponent Na+:H+ antiporter subunit F n=1 Tax=Natronocella acetinitrilica TaxID=414046 RepID=A0AAE3KCG4_9GAMM|nr:monovalent cation/H+ antiporter complex subunit F [Natronocella acetinitrilica]MCP1674913.1 multicomponent Na+:H+ antiporter subunit F [Natronocella acetinitrilica]
MTVFLTGATITLTLLFALSLLRLYLGPTEADRVTAIQLTGTSTVGILLLLSLLLDMSALIIAALLFVLFAALVGVAFVRQPTRGQ